MSGTVDAMKMPPNSPCFTSYLASTTPPDGAPPPHMCTYVCVCNAEVMMVACVCRC
jgi:hypothetical protein